MTESTALTVIERAQVALQPAANDKQLTELAEQSKSITTITNPAGYQQCHSARMALKNQRVAIEKIAKGAREDATAFSKAVIAEEKRLIGLIQPEEERLEGLQTAWDEARAAEKKAREEAERARLAEIQRRIAKLETLGSGDVYTAAMPPDRLADIIQQLEQPAQFDYQEFTEQATALRQKAITALRQAHVESMERIEREAAAERARVAQAEREAAERAERERQEAEARAAEEARLAEEQRRRDAENAAEAERLAEVRRRLDAEQAEQRRIASINTRMQLLGSSHGHLTAVDPPELIEQAIQTVESALIDETYGEFQEAAKQTKSATIARLSTLLESARAHRAEQDRIAAERAELERQQREQAERQAEIERREREQREAEERQRREAAEAEERRRAEEWAEAERAREAEERAAALARAKEEARRLLASLTAKAIAEWIADDISCEIHEVAARIVEIPREDWLTLAMGSEAQEEAA